MQKWYLSFLILILLLFHLKVIRIKKQGRRIWIGKNKKTIFQNNIPYSVRVSAKRSIAKEMPLKVRWKWWKQEHPKLAKYGLRLVISIVFMCFGMPIMMGAEVTIDDNATYAGMVDYDPHLYSNSDGHFVVIYNTQASNERICAKTSDDTGATWSARIILFSNDTQNDGIIDSDIGGYWEMSGEVYDNILYFACEIYWGATVTTAFTKCDISDITNVATWSNWLSADGSPPPSQGNATNGAGYDAFGTPTWTRYFDPSLTIRPPNEIILGVVSPTAAPKDFFVYYFNGSAWSAGTAYDFAENVLATVSVRRMSNKDIVSACYLDAVDGNDYIVMVRLSSGDSPTVAANWKKMDGSAGFDYVIDTGNGAMVWPRVVVDSNDYVHVVTSTLYTIEVDPPAGYFYRRAYHNWYDGSSWQEGSSENNAGAMIIGMAGIYMEPRMYTATRNIGIGADAGGNVFIIFVTWGGPSGDGTYTLKWDNSAQDWDYNTYTYQAIKRAVCSNNHVAGVLTVSPFTICHLSATAQYYVEASGATSGTPWWEAVPKPTGGGSNCKLMLPLELSG